MSRYRHPSQYDAVVVFSRSTNTGATLLPSSYLPSLTIIEVHTHRDHWVPTHVITEMFDEMILYISANDAKNCSAPPQPNARN